MKYTTLQALQRRTVIAYLASFIKKGRLQIMEEGGNVLVFGEKNRIFSERNESKSDASSSSASTTKVVYDDMVIFIHVNSPEFYSKIAMRFDLGFAEAYMAGHFSTRSLVTLFKLLILNRDGMWLSDTFIHFCRNSTEHAVCRRNYNGFTWNS